MTAPVIAAKGLSHAYGNHEVLSEVSLTVSAGRCLALVGPNGAGKSTLLRCLVGQQEPSGGSVLLDGKPTSESATAFRRSVASLLDDLDFFPDLTVHEHLDLFARAHEVDDPDVTVADVLTDLGIGGVRDQFPGTLSSGQRRRVALASVFVRPRRLLVLDEPEQRLDAEGRAWLGDRLMAELASGVAIVLASHDAALVDAVADKTLKLGT